MDRLRQRHGDEQRAQPAQLPRRQRVRGPARAARAAELAERESFARSLRRKRRRAHRALRPGSPCSASAVSAARRCSRPCPTGRATPGSRSANGRAARSAASTQAVSRDSRASASQRCGSACQSRTSGPPPLCAFERLGVPAGAARHRLPCHALRRIAVLVVAQPREVGVVAARRRGGVRAVAAPRQRRRVRFGRGIDDAVERKMHVGPAAPQAQRMVGREGDAAERNASARAPSASAA